MFLFKFDRFFFNSKGDGLEVCGLPIAGKERDSTSDGTCCTVKMEQQYRQAAEQNLKYTLSNTSSYLTRLINQNKQYYQGKSSVSDYNL